MRRERERFWEEMRGIALDIEKLSNGESLLSYMGDRALELYYRITHEGEFAGVEITLGLGNPTIWINYDGSLIGLLCGERVELSL